MRLRDTAVERFGRFTLHPCTLRSGLSVPPFYRDNQGEAAGPSERTQHEPRFNAIARERNLGRDGGYVREQ